MASGRASTSVSCTRLKPSMAEPSKVMPSSRAFSSSAGVMLNPLGVPSTSVNHIWTKRIAALFDGPQDVVALALHPVQSGRSVSRVRPGVAGAPSTGRRTRRQPATSGYPWACHGPGRGLGAGDNHSAVGRRADSVHDEPADHVRVHVGVRTAVLEPALLLLGDLPRDADRRAAVGRAVAELGVVGGLVRAGEPVSIPMP